MSVVLMEASPERQGVPMDRPRRLIRSCTYVAGVLLAGVLLLGLPTPWRASAGTGHALHGCLYYDDDIDAETDRGATFGVELRYDECNRHIESRSSSGARAA